MLRVIYHPEAEAELIEAAWFYNKKVPGLGADLLAEMDRAVTVILDEPARWRAIDGDIRRYCVKRFPYALIYRLDQRTVRILAVKHHSRHPNYWKHRKTE